MRRWVALVVVLAACDGGNGGGDGTCNTDNEDCTTSSCGGEGANMLPGSDCLECHASGVRSGDEGEQAPVWTAAGTAYVDFDGTEPLAGAIVHVTDADGKTVDLTTSSSGNFYTREALTAPINASIETDAGTVSMPDPQATGACNSCHLCGGEAGGKLYGE